jgi:DNA-binding transcriptional regulator PaaX
MSARWPKQSTKVRGDRVYLRKCEDEQCWDLVEFNSEGERILAKFFTGNQNNPGNLASRALEEIRISEKV